MLRRTTAETQRKDTERVAHKLYQNRLPSGKSGNECSDWAKAEKIVSSSIRKALFEINQPLVKLSQPTRQAFKFIAWDTPKWFLFSLPKLEWMKLLAVPLVITAAGSIITTQIQRETNQNAVLKAYFDKLDDLTFKQNLLDETPDVRAIVLARGRTVAALRELDHARRTQLIAFLQASNLSRTKEDLATPIISFREQNLFELDLHRIDLSYLDFQESDLRRAKLKGARLRNAKLQEANLRGANLQGADLENANLQKARLFYTNLQGANLQEANLQEADLQGANLQRANLLSANHLRDNLRNANLRRARRFYTNLQETFRKNANLQGANLQEANLQEANLQGANLQGARLLDTNLQGAWNLTQDQIALAKLCRTTLPKDITLDPNRDCEELRIDPETGEDRLP